MYRSFAGCLDPFGGALNGRLGRTALPAIGGGTGEVLSDGQFAVATDLRTDGGRFLCLLDGHLVNPDHIARLGGTSPTADVETIVARAFEELGAKIIGELRGDFALVLWDRTEGKGILAQDHLGNRTLFLGRVGNCLLFSNEMPALLRLFPRRPAPSAGALVSWLSNTPVPRDLTFYEGVRRLGGGHYVELTRNGWTEHRYWSPAYQPPVTGQRAELAQELRSGVERAVARRARGLEHVGVLLSGGVDSSTVAAVARGAVEGQGGRLTTYSAVFPDVPLVDESEKVETLTRDLGITSTRVEIQPGGSLALSLEWLQRWELPLLGPGLLLEWPLVRCAADDGAAAILDGQGGDELFGLSPYLLSDLVGRGRMLAWMRMAKQLVGDEQLSVRRIRHLLRASIEGAVPYRLHQEIRRRRPRRHIPPILRPDAGRLHHEITDPWHWQERRHAPRWWAFLADLVTSRERLGASEYLRQRGRMAGVEAKPPLLDLELVELILRLPPQLAFDPLLDRPLVRESMRGLVPDPVRLSVTKSNLSAFWHQGLAGPELPAVRKLLGKTPEISAYVRPEAIRKLVERPPAIGSSGWERWVAQVWSMVTTECWLRFQEDPSHPENLLATWDLPRAEYRISRHEGLAPA